MGLDVGGLALLSDAEEADDDEAGRAQVEDLEGGKGTTGLLDEDLHCGPQEVAYQCVEEGHAGAFSRALAFSHYILLINYTAWMHSSLYY